VSHATTSPPQLDSALTRWDTTWGNSWSSVPAVVPAAEPIAAERPRVPTPPPPPTLAPLPPPKPAPTTAQSCLRAQRHDLAVEHAMIVSSPAEVDTGAARLSSTTSTSDHLHSLLQRRLQVLLASQHLSAWRSHAASQRPKRHAERRQRVAMALRKWHCRVRNRCFKRELPLLQVLARVTYAVLRTAWNGLRSPPSARCCAIMLVLRGCAQRSLAQCHRRRALLARALAALWREAVATATDAMAAQTALQCDAHSPVERCVLDATGCKRHQGSVLLQVQRLSWQRWRRATLMELNAVQYQGKRRQAMMLLLLRNLTQNASALRHRVRTLQLCCFNAMRRRSEASEASAEVPGLRVEIASAALHCRGLRGMSVAEVLRKGWRRWRFAKSVGEWCPLPRRRPEHVSVLLQSLNEEIRVANHNNVDAQGVLDQCTELKAKPGRLPVCQVAGRALPPPPPPMAFPDTATSQSKAAEDLLHNVPGCFLPPPARPFETEHRGPMALPEPPHLVLMQQTLQSFGRLLDQQHGLLPQQPQPQQRPPPPPPPTDFPQVPLHPALLWTVPGEQMLEASEPVGEDSETEGGGEVAELDQLESQADERTAWIGEVSSWFPPRPLVGVALPLGDLSCWQPSDDAGGSNEREEQDMDNGHEEEQEDGQQKHVPGMAEEASAFAEPGCGASQGQFSCTMTGRALLSRPPEGCRSSAGRFTFTQPASAQEADHSALVLSARSVSSEGCTAGVLVEDYQSLRRRIRSASGPCAMSSTLTSGADSRQLRGARISLGRRPLRGAYPP